LKPLTATEVLQVWEESSGQPLIDKSIRLLAKACSVSNPDQLFHLSIGDRDARLLRIREWMFGYTLRNKVNCPKCAETIEWETNTRDLHLKSYSQDLSVKKFYLESNDYSVQFRLPDSLDLFEITKEPKSEDSGKKMISNCILTITKNDIKCVPDDLPLSVWEALSDRMSEEDPQADIRMNLTCPACRHDWEANFDIAGYLWTEINNWARRILAEVSLLAKAFSWSEQDLLNMSPYRRQLYIELLQK